MGYNRNRKWDYDSVKEEASKYKSRGEFEKGCRAAYNVALRNGWINDFEWFVKSNKNKWYYESVKEEASKYNSRMEFAKGKSGAYNVALKNGWLDDFDWLVKTKKVKWDYDSIKEEASKYKSRNEFQKRCGYAYTVARINGWLDECFVHSIKTLWDYDSTKEEAKKYKSKSEFKNGCVSAYCAARKNGWSENFDWFVTPKRKVKWDYDSVKDAANKCKTRNEFHKRYGRAYVVALKNGWLDDFGWLKDARFDLFKDKIDCVYAYEFNELNSVYVGRTLMRMKKQRDRDHIFKEEDTVAIFARQNNIPIPKPKILEEYLTIEEGSKQEGYWLQWYIDNGWIGLNRRKTGSIGGLGKGKWNYESVKEEASKYKSKSEFKKGCGSAYVVARKNGWLENFDWFVVSKRKIEWNYESVKEEASKYKSRSEFNKGCERAYNAALKMGGWINGLVIFINRGIMIQSKMWQVNTRRGVSLQKDIKEHIMLH